MKLLFLAAFSVPSQPHRKFVCPGSTSAHALSSRHQAGPPPIPAHFSEGRVAVMTTLVVFTHITHLLILQALAYAVALIVHAARHHTMVSGFIAQLATKLVVGPKFVPLGLHVAVQMTLEGVVRQNLGNALPTTTVSSL
jgi:hypothetical protein